MIGLCTDSSSQLPPDLAGRFGVEIVPITVTVDGDDHLEGVDLDADSFYAKFGPGHVPVVSTSQPSPGQFALAYDELVARGATEILSIHVGAAVSGTLNSARLAARTAAVPVRLVDSGTASFGIGCCVWAAARAIEVGASLDAAAGIAERLAPRIGNVFIVGGLDLIRAGGRGGDALSAANIADGIPVLSLVDGQVRVVGRAATVGEAVDSMARTILDWRGPDGEGLEGEGLEREGPEREGLDWRGPDGEGLERAGLEGRSGLRVAIGFADRQAAPIGVALEAAVRRSPAVTEIVHYRVGPSVGAHTGPGTAGAFYF